MTRLDNYAIDVPMAAKIVDATLYRCKHPDYPALSVLLQHLKQDESTTVVDLQQSLVPALSDMARNWPRALLSRLSQALSDGSLSRPERERRIHVEISTTDLQRLSAIRILGLVRDVRAEEALRQIIMDPMETVTVRSASLVALSGADQVKCLDLAAQILSSTAWVKGSVCRLVPLNESAGSVQGSRDGEPELFLRYCLRQVASIGGKKARLLLFRVLHDRDKPLPLRQMASDLLHDREGSPNRSESGVVKFVSYLS